MALCDEGFGSVACLDEADPAIFASYPASVRGVVQQLISFATEDGRAALSRPVCGV